MIAIAIVFIAISAICALASYLKDLTKKLKPVENTNFNRKKSILATFEKIPSNKNKNPGYFIGKTSEKRCPNCDSQLPENTACCLKCGFSIIEDWELGFPSPSFTTHLSEWQCGATNRTGLMPKYIHFFIKHYRTPPYLFHLPCEHCPHCEAHATLHCWMVWWDPSWLQPCMHRSSSLSHWEAATAIDANWVVTKNKANRIAITFILIILLILILLYQSNNSDGKLDTHINFN